MHGKHVTRAAGLSLFVMLGLAVFAVIGAQPEASASTRGVFKVLGKSVPSGLAVKVSGIQEGQVTFTIASLNFEVVCKSFVTVEGELSPEGVGSVKFLYEGCAMWVTKGSELTEALPCKVKHATFEALLLVMSHEGRTYLLAEGKKNAKGETLPIVTIENVKEALCAFSEGLAFRGSYAYELSTGDLQKGPEVSEMLLLAGSKAQGLLGDKLLYGTQTVGVEGSVKLVLTGAHGGCSWGAI